MLHWKPGGSKLQGVVCLLKYVPVLVMTSHKAINRKSHDPSHGHTPLQVPYLEHDSRNVKFALNSVIQWEAKRAGSSALHNFHTQPFHQHLISCEHHHCVFIMLYLTRV
jgi:hypothetical protein